MSKNVYLGTGAVVVVLLLGLLSLKQFGGSDSPAQTAQVLPIESQESSTAENADSQESAEATLKTEAEASSPSESSVPESASTAGSTEGAVITYTDNGFTPAVLIVKAGTTVDFQNKSSRLFQPASAEHPTHAVYPEVGGCTASLFDACQPISVTGGWSFTFRTPGAWKYHDHLSPNFTGTVVVQ